MAPAPARLDLPIHQDWADGGAMVQVKGKATLPWDRDWLAGPVALVLK